MGGEGQSKRALVGASDRLAALFEDVGSPGAPNVAAEAAHRRRAAPTEGDPVA